MPTAWRVVRREYVDTAFPGEGARRFGGRWNPKGTPVAYLSATRSLALLEVLVRAVDASDIVGLVPIPLTFAESDVEGIPPDQLPDD